MTTELIQTQQYNRLKGRWDRIEATEYDVATSIIMILQYFD